MTPRDRAAGVLEDALRDAMVGWYPWRVETRVHRTLDALAAAGLEVVERGTVEALRLLDAGDWAGMIEWAREHNCLPDRHGAGHVAEYEWKGDHHEDARYTYPARTRLRNAILRALLPDSEGST